MACLAAKNRARISVKLYLPRERKRRDPRIPWACTMSIIFSTSPCDLFHWLTAIARKPFSRVERRNERAEQSRTGRGRASESRGAGRRARSRYTPQRCLVCQWVTKCTIYPHICVPMNAACRTIPIQSGPADSEWQSNLGLNRPIHRGEDSSSLFLLSIIIFISRSRLLLLCIRLSMTFLDEIFHQDAILEDVIYWRKGNWFRANFLLG